VRQGDSGSPLLLHLFVNDTIKVVGHKIGDKELTIRGYDDDTVLIAGSENNLQNYCTRLLCQK
jgi:hypothetical protein